MARTARAPQALAYTGTTLNFTAVDGTNGEQWAYAGGRNKLLVNNASASAVIVTIKSNSTTLDGAVVPDHVVPVPANSIVGVVEGPTELEADGNVYVNYSASTSVTACLIQT